PGAGPSEAGPSGTDESSGSGDTGPAEPGARRPRGKATLGSTSYDDANAGPFEPDWSGASWYGTTSGTYWTINPKEYADPRKHGPEYQARGRRRGPGAPPPEPDDPLEAPIAEPRRAASDAPSPPGPTGFDGRWATPEVQRPG